MGFTKSLRHIMAGDTLKRISDNQWYKMNNEIKDKNDKSNIDVKCQRSKRTYLSFKGFIVNKFYLSKHFETDKTGNFLIK